MAARTKSRKPGRSAKVIVGVAVAVVILFTMVSLGCHLAGLRTAEQNYCGWLGHQLATALFFVLGWASVLLPLLAAGAAVLSLAKRPPWRRYASAGTIVFGFFSAAALVSHHTGAALGSTNAGGWLGFQLATHFSRVLGFGAYCLPLIAVLVGIGLWVRWHWRQHLYRSLLAAFIGLFFDVFIAYFAPHAVWNTATGHGFSLAGLVGLLVNAGLRSLVGPVGTIILLAAVAVIMVGVFGTAQISPDTRLREKFRSLFARRRPKLQVSSGFKPEVAAVPVSTQTAQSVSSGSEPVREPELPESRDTVARPRPRPLWVMTDFDISRFQASFLEQLDQPGPEDQLFKDPREASREAEQLLDKLRQFGVEGRVTNIVSGPMITRFEFEPAPGIKIQRIENLADDLSLALSAERIRILAPIPGKSAVGIEIPNKERRTVYLRDILTSDAFRQEKPPLGFALGTTITGEPYCADLRTMPHILIAGTTGSGKSVCINSIITSLIYRSSHRDVRFLTIDPKQLELPVYNPIPHLLNMATIDPKKAVSELDQVIKIMEVRYGEFAELGVRDIVGYNARAEADGLERKPYIVIIIDELADLMLRAPTEIEERITRLAQMSRAVGIHLILATQRPSVDVITGLIKANFPCRIAFQVASKTDSRTILDMNGAESLLGRGDMLFLPPGKGDPIRLHGAFVSDRAAKQVVNLWTVAYLSELLKGSVPDPVEKAKAMVQAEVVDILYDPEKSGIRKKRQDLCSILPEEVADELLSRDYYEPLPEVRSGALDEHERKQQRDARELDEYFAEAARLVVRHREASVSMLQRRLDVGWARAGRIIDQLEEAGVVGPYVGSKSRKVMVSNEAELEQLLSGMKSGLRNGEEPASGRKATDDNDDNA
ncbi:MAG: DNA translocase FtsK 4TM domain-containing protein [candidate division WOR-3 bacterium]